MNIYQLRHLAGREEIDYPFIIEQLYDYHQPRSKIREWLQKGELIRVKKGIYVFAPFVAQRPFCKEWLANLIYSPSAISLEFALAYYGLIPMEVTTFTNVTCQRNKLFSTPVGKFSYRFLPMEKYQVGIMQQPILAGQHHVLMASPEKALIDTLYLANAALVDVEQMYTYLLGDLRMEWSDLLALDRALLRTLSEIYQHRNITLLYQMLRGAS